MREFEMESHLEHEATECPEADHVERDPYHQLMRDSADEEYTAGGQRLVHLHVQAGEVDVPQEPLVHRNVPQPPIVPDGGGVPPVLQDVNDWNSLA